MTVARPVQTSLLPDLVPDRPTGPILPSVITGTNADLIAAVAPLYLTGSVCDVTYGLGGWWTRYQPLGLATHDLDRTKGDGVDFRALPESDGAYDAVCFDPPYVPQGGMSDRHHHGVADFRGRFGLTDESTPWWETKALMVGGLTECGRVSRRWVLAKCGDFVSGGRFHLGHKWMLEAADACGLGDPWDVIIHHTGSGPGGHNIYEPIRARRHHSYLLVFRVPA
jgi:hypothetical protein